MSGNTLDRQEYQSRFVATLFPNINDTFESSNEPFLHGIGIARSRQQGTGSERGRRRTRLLRGSTTTWLDCALTILIQTKTTKFPQHIFRKFFNSSLRTRLIFRPSYYSLFASKSIRIIYEFFFFFLLG